MMAIGSVFFFFFCHIMFFSFHANNPFAYAAAATHVAPNCSGRPCLAPSQEKYSYSDTRMVESRYTQSSQEKYSHNGTRIVDSSYTRSSQETYSHSSTRMVVYGRRGARPFRRVDPFSGHIVGSADHLVKVGFGTSMIKYFNLIVDTGSYITWVNCKTTEENQSSHYYHPHNISATREHFSQSYLDNSTSEGFFVHDTLTIPPSDVFPNFTFACAQQNSGDFDGADGILGLGLAGSRDNYGDYSFMSQTKTMAFCHCNDPSTAEKGYLYFGKEALEKCQNSASYTPLLTNLSFYYVNLIAITIGQKRLNLSSSNYAAASSSWSSSSPGTIIDSGTVISRLPRLVYSELKSEFKELMSGYPPADRDEILDTCYNLENSDISTIPKMELHFEKLDVPLDQTAVTSRGPKGDSQVCLAFAAKDDERQDTIIGNHQLLKLNVLYNIQDQRVEIGPGNC